MLTPPQPVEPHATAPDFLGLPGLRPIRSLLIDPEVTEIMINGPRKVFVEREGRMQPVDLTFDSERQLNLLIETIVRPSGRMLDAQTPYVDCRLPDGSRVNIVLPPLSLGGAAVTIRKFTGRVRSLQDLVRMETVSPDMATLLDAAVRARLNMVFSGATGTGKTTLLGILATNIPPSERIVAIEDTAELVLGQPNVVRLECRRANVEGKGEVTLEQLLRNSLRMRPTRIVVGEIRGSEAVEMVQAITSGHAGCLAVLHASSPEDALARLEMMVLSRGLPVPVWAIQRQLARALDLIVQLELLPDGVRKVTRVTEVTGAENDGVGLRDLFRFESAGPDASGRVQGRWVSTGTTPGLVDRFARMGVALPGDLFGVRGT
jgi:pilus assembly protein CpaF